MQEAVSAIEKCRKVVFAAVHGACIGGGIHIITACDIRYCCEDAKFSVKDVDVGITANLGTLQRLPGIVGFGNAIELELTGRVFGAEKVKGMRLVSKVFGSKEELDQGVCAIAQDPLHPLLITSPPLPSSSESLKKTNIIMAMISTFTTVDKTAHNSRKFAFTFSPTNYGYWKTMIEPFLITDNLIGYVDSSIPCPSKTLSITNRFSVPKETPNYPIWVSNDAHIHMLIISTISEAYFYHVQGTTSCDVWLSLEKAYAPHSISREYTLKTQLLRIKMHGDETPDDYLSHAQEYADALAAIGEPIKDKYLVMLAVSDLREEYNGFKTTITGRQSPTTFSQFHALLSDHDYMLEKTHTPITPSSPQAF
ncbi:putative ribonuclease H-like domain-containing protein [Tanacetum coccineum]